MSRQPDGVNKENTMNDREHANGVPKTLTVPTRGSAPHVTCSAGSFPDELWPRRRSTLLGILGAASMMASGTGVKAVQAESTRDEPIAGEARNGRIDVHAHFLPEHYRSALAAAGHSKPSGMPGIPNWSVEQAIAMMDRLNIDAAVLSISAPGLHFGDDAAARKLARYTNEKGAEAMRAHPTRFGLFAALPLPDIDGSLAEIEYAFDTLGCDGVVVESNHNGVYLGDRKLDPVFEELNRRHAKIFIHPTNPHCPCCQDPTALPPIGYPFPMIEFMFETTRAVFNLILSGTLDRYPNVKVIVPHAGATVPVLADRVAGLSPALGLPKPLDVPRFYKTLRGLYYDLAGFPLPRQIGPLLEIADPKHILYGSDWPYTPEPLVADLAKKLDATALMSPRMRVDVMRKNALALFPRFR
ncbi:amidohydrolase family protein [Caballeronia sp. INDeC2]|uniref:amidohydrolase family protein n=1 Tax=Caballeronia sp. INDeC2 TaxID=2921747 RepID=UPI002028B532|nr:amidohydrolase family protein [Caballeronia sp. INDeC2]